MNQNITVIQQNVDVSTIENELHEPRIAGLWESYGSIFYAFKHTETLLLLGASTQGSLDENAFRNNSDVTNYHLNLFPQTAKWLSNNFKNVQRASFIKLFKGRRVEMHRDVGEYFKNTQRFHLCIQGEYIYRVGEESLHVKPGTLFTFDNDVLHGTQNVKDCDRITLVFDILRV